MFCVVFRNLNMLAFVKILKKFDKVSIITMIIVFLSGLINMANTFLCVCVFFSQVTNKQVLPIYLKVVESSYFNSSDKVNLQH